MTVAAWITSLHTGEFECEFDVWFWFWFNPLMSFLCHFDFFVQLRTFVYGFDFFLFGFGLDFGFNFWVWNLAVSLSFLVLGFEFWDVIFMFWGWRSLLFLNWAPSFLLSVKFFLSRREVVPTEKTLWVVTSKATWITSLHTDCIRMILVFELELEFGSWVFYGWYWILILSLSFDSGVFLLLPTLAMLVFFFYFSDAYCFFYCSDVFLLMLPLAPHYSNMNLLHPLGTPSAIRSMWGRGCEGRDLFGDWPGLVPRPPLRSRRGRLSSIWTTALRYFVLSMRLLLSSVVIGQWTVGQAIGHQVFTVVYCRARVLRSRPGPLFSTWTCLQYIICATCENLFERMQVLNWHGAGFTWF